MQAKLSRPRLRQFTRVVTKNARLKEKTRAADAKFFERHPDRTYFVRSVSLVEREKIEALQGGTFNQRLSAPRAFAAIKQIVPGFRLRVVVFGPEEAVGEDLTDAKAGSIWEGYADLHPETRKGEDAMRDAIMGARHG